MNGQHSPCRLAWPCCPLPTPLPPHIPGLGEIMLHPAVYEPGMQVRWQGLALLPLLRQWIRATWQNILGKECPVGTMPHAFWVCAFLPAWRRLQSSELTGLCYLKFGKEPTVLGWWGGQGVDNGRWSQGFVLEICGPSQDKHVFM